MGSWIVAIAVAAIRSVTAIVLALIRRKRKDPPPDPGTNEDNELGEGEERDKVATYQEQVRNMLEHVAADVGTDPSWLSKLIQFESNWDPQAKNPNSSAQGLIQFTDSTAKDLGYFSAADLVNHNPDTLMQLDGPVRRYLLKHAPLETDQKLFMSVFYPAAMDWPLDREFPEHVQEANKGIRTVRDYVNLVYRRPDPWAITIMVLAVAGIATFLISTR